MTWFVASYLLLWLILIVQAVMLLVLARQIGILHRRIHPTGARITNVGLEIGDKAPSFSEVDIHGRTRSLDVQPAQASLLVFISLSCPTCEELVPAIRTVHKNEDLQSLVVSMTGTDEENRAFVKRHRLSNVPYLTAPHLADAYKVTASPYAIVVDSYGRVFSKGLVNTLEQLESLVEALDKGFHTVDDRIATRHTEQSASP